MDNIYDTLDRLYESDGEHCYELTHDGQRWEFRGRVRGTGIGVHVANSDRRCVMDRVVYFGRQHYTNTIVDIIADDLLGGGPIANAVDQFDDTPICIIGQGDSERRIYG